MKYQHFQVVYHKTKTIVGYVTAIGANSALRKASKEYNIAIRYINVEAC